MTITTTALRKMEHALAESAATTSANMPADGVLSRGNERDVQSAAWCHGAHKRSEILRVFVSVGSCVKYQAIVSCSSVKFARELLLLVVLALSQKWCQAVK